MVTDADLEDWAAGSRKNFAAVAELVGAPADEAERDPVSVVPLLQVYVNRLPLTEFQTDDWVTLHADLVSFVARVMAARLGAAWEVRPAPNAPRGYRYVLSATDAQGAVHVVDPFQVVAMEFRQPRIEIARMLATAELNLGVPDR
ncbi:hypothetical protein ACQEVZ_19805 [Dactylosporangium sp. CA-152071]|uniref:hypothetical protein n=1 Tax=unclassified Dactylosporangium TaxID=2621675 RepID=UPI0033F369AF